MKTAPPPDDGQRRLRAPQEDGVLDIEKPGANDAEILDSLLAIDRAVFADLLRASKMGDALDLLCRAVEAQAPGLLCSILVLDYSRTRLFHGAAPSLPESYARAIDGGTIGPSAGSCGTAAY